MESGSNNRPANGQTLPPAILKEAFIEWLSKGNTKKYPTSTFVDCIDKISDYVISRKISCSIWEIHKLSAYKPVFQKVMDAKLLRVLERNTYKTFAVVGQLYLQFLKDRPWEIFSTNEQDIAENNNLDTDIINIINNHSLRYKDNRELNGALWVFGGTELSEVMNKIGELGYHFNFKSDGGRSSNFQSAWWYKPVITTVANAEKPVQKITEELPKTSAKSTVTFEMPASYAHTRPESLSYFGEEYVVENWTQLYVKTACSLYEDYPEVIKKLNGANIGQRGRMDIADSSLMSQMVAPKELHNGLYIETNLSATDITTKIKLLLDLCLVDYENVVITYSSTKTEMPAAPLTTTAVTMPISAKTPAFSNSKAYTFSEGEIRDKYAPLKRWLIESGNEVVRMSFSNIADLVGGLPPSAYKHRAFWSNADSRPSSVVWVDAGYKVVECNLQTQYVCFAKNSVRSTPPHTCNITIKAALIEFSNNYKGQPKTRRDIVDELLGKYGFNEYSILPADYEIGRNNGLPKLFRRIEHGTFECLGYNATQSPPPITSTCALVDDDEKEKILGLIVSRFKSGIRKLSNIDFERFKNYYVVEYGEKFGYNLDWFNYLLTTEALVYDDRAYIYTVEIVNSVRLFLEQMESPCIFIEYFFEKHSVELYASSIFSVEMLRAFVEKNYPDIAIKWDYILLQENASPADIIREIFSEREAWSFDEIQERLPCLKMDTIRQTLNSAEYFRVNKGTYTHIDNMDLPNGEGERIQIFVESKLQERDYITANELGLSKFVDLNPHCSFAAIRDAVFYKFLSSQYDKSGQVITRVGGKLRVLDIMEQYCREADSVSFEELNAFEATFDPEGRTHSQCLIAGHNTMVRVSADLFVSDSQVDFDVPSIDEAIALYCNDNFISIREITDFSLFPFAGYSWNLFLLESYVRRFSNIFKYDVRAVNSANIGAIVRKSFDYGRYDDILAYVLAKSPVRLSDKQAVGNYLFDNGYIGWRNLGKSESKITESAKALREGGKV